MLGDSFATRDAIAQHDGRHAFGGEIPRDFIAFVRVGQSHIGAAGADDHAGVGGLFSGLPVLVDRLLRVGLFAGRDAGPEIKCFEILGVGARAERGDERDGDGQNRQKIAFHF